MAFCTNCGKELSESMKFCANCGAPVEVPKMKSVTIEKTEAQIASGVLEANETSGVNGNAKENSSVSHTKYTDSKLISDRGNKSKEKKRIPLFGIIALLLALIGFFGDPPVLTVVLSLAAFVLAVSSLIRKEKWKGIAIAALVIAALSIGVTAANHNNEKNTSEKTGTTVTESSENQKSETTAITESEQEETEPVEEAAEFSVDGITFMVPGKYQIGDDGSFSYKNGEAVIYFGDGGEGTTDENFTAVADKMDTMMDEMAENIMTDWSRKSAIESETAGFKSRTYCYTGKIDGKDGVTYFVLINNTKKNCLVFICAASLDDLKAELEADFNEVLVTAKYTNASDTQKISNAGETTESMNEDTDTSNASDSGEVDPDLKAFLDEYEDFVDEYVDFMQKYSENPTDLSLLADYADIMQEYTEFAEKLDKYDSNTMSTADAAYYLEVTTRCTEKMLKVAGSIGN